MTEKEKDKSEEMGYIQVRQVPESLKRRFKAACVLKGVSMQDIMLSMITRWTDKQIPTDTESVDSE